MELRRTRRVCATLSIALVATLSASCTATQPTDEAPDAASVSEQEPVTPEVEQTEAPAPAPSAVQEGPVSRDPYYHPDAKENLRAIEAGLKPLEAISVERIAAVVTVAVSLGTAVALLSLGASGWVA